MQHKNDHFLVNGKSDNSTNVTKRWFYDSLHSENMCCHSSHHKLFVFYVCINCNLIIENVFWRALACVKDIILFFLKEQPVLQVFTFLFEKMLYSCNSFIKVSVQSICPVMNISQHCWFTEFSLLEADDTLETRGFHLH